MQTNSNCYINDNNDRLEPDELLSPGRGLGKDWREPMYWCRCVVMCVVLCCYVYVVVVCALFCV